MKNAAQTTASAFQRFGSSSGMEPPTRTGVALPRPLVWKRGRPSRIPAACRPGRYWRRTRPRGRRTRPPSRSPTRRRAARAASSETSRRTSSYSSAVACGSQLDSSSVTGQRACFPFRSPRRMSTSPATSTPVKQTSPSPIDACRSPTASIPPGCRTGMKIRAPAPCRWSSRFPPCCPARRFGRSSPSVATPITPTIGAVGNGSALPSRISRSSNSKTRVCGACTRSMSCPNPGIRVANAGRGRAHLRGARRPASRRARRREPRSARSRS